MNGGDTSAHWTNTGEGGEACGAIINVTSTNYFGSGGYGGFYCFAYITGAE